MIVSILAGGVGLTDEEMALIGVGRTKILLENARDQNERALVRAMGDAYMGLWREAVSDEDQRDKR